MQKENVERFLQYLNSRDQNIHFPLELEQNREMPSLDVRAQRTAEGKIKTGVHRKATHSGQILAFDSHHPVRAKAAVVRALLDRVNSHFAESDFVGKEEELKRAPAELAENGYSMIFINRRMKQKKKNVQKTSSPAWRIGAPYISEINEAIKSVETTRIGVVP